MIRLAPVVRPAALALSALERPRQGRPGAGSSSSFLLSPAHTASSNAVVVTWEKDTDLHNQDTDVDNQDTLALEMRDIVRGAAEPWSPGDGIKAAIGRAARRLGLSYRRARSFWYGDPRAAVRAEEADRLRRRHWELLHERRRRIEAEAARLDALLARAEGDAGL